MPQTTGNCQVPDVAWFCGTPDGKVDAPEITGNSPSADSVGKSQYKGERDIEASDIPLIEPADRACRVSSRGRGRLIEFGHRFDPLQRLMRVARNKVSDLHGLAPASRPHAGGQANKAQFAQTPPAPTFASPRHPCFQCSVLRFAAKCVHP
jgi:hypothetical protein